jgi:acetylornithine aminotransferase/acetylornithine/N-succinyldiaminopimelate aminotransferase
MAKKINPAATIQLEAKHLMPTYKRPPLVFTHGKGCWVWDHRGKKYLDFLSGIAVNALGHGHPRLVRVVQREAARAIHVSNLFHNPYQGPLPAKLAKCSELDRVFFTNSGTEAIEGALKLARLYARKKTGMDAPPAKTRILALENSFHGRTFGAVAITATAKYREPYEPVLPGAEFVRFNDVADLEAKFSGDVCAIVLETIQGEGGIYPVSEAFWNRARELCTQHDCALVADEIQCGLGRTGRWFAYQKFTTRPDIVTVAKPLAGGLPLGAFIANEQFAAAFAPGLHGTTFGGGPMICAAALEFLRAVEDAKLMANARTRGAELRAGLAKLAARFDFIREVRGEGLMLGVELAVDGNEYARQALKRGLIFNCTHDRVLRLLPPLIITAKDVREFLARFEAVLAETPRPQPSASHAPQARAAAR